MTNNNEAHLMANEIQRAIKEYIDSVGDTKIEKYHNDDLKYEYKSFIDNFLKNIKPFFKTDVELRKHIEAIKKIKKEKGQSDLYCLDLKYKKIVMVVKKNVSLDTFISSIINFEKKILGLKKRNKYEKWIDWAVKNGKGIYLATHVAKLSHSSSKASSIDYRFFERNQEIRTKYLATKIDNDLILDWAYPDNALSSIAALYNIFVSGSYIGDILRRDGFPYLRSFTATEEKALQWSQSFKFNIREDAKKNHFLSKQVYFLVDDNQYHLLMPLTSSSMAHALFLKFKEFFDDENALIREQKKKHKYYENLAVSYPNRASLNVTGSNHSNASSLNGKRGGRLTLLSSTPPKWTGRKKLPISQRDLFDKSLGYKLREEINDLQRLLLIIKSKEIGIKKPEMHRAIVSYVEAIANALFDEVNKINVLSKQIGWTVHSAFPLHQQWLLEPNREDEAMTDEKNKKQWLDRVAEDFSCWLNQQLKHKKLNLTPIQQRLWKDIFMELTRNYISIQESSL